MCGACGSGIARPPWEAVLGGHDHRARRHRAAHLSRLAGLKPSAVVPWGPAGYLVSLAGRPPTLCTGIDRACQALARHVERAVGKPPPSLQQDRCTDVGLVGLKVGADVNALIVCAALWLVSPADRRAHLIVTDVAGHRQAGSAHLSIASGPSPLLTLDGPGASGFAHLTARRLPDYVERPASPTRLLTRGH